MHEYSPGASLESAAAVSLDARGLAALAWVEKITGKSATRFAPASADASFRRYFRVYVDGHSHIVMDAPPERENCRPFIYVTSLMKDAGVHVPTILAQDLSQGFLLLTDLGMQTYLDVLNPSNANEFFNAAITALVKWQKASVPGLLPDYDTALLQRELDLFPDWFLAKHLGVELTGTSREQWQVLCQRLIDQALQQPQVFVHRDFMPRNLMVSTPNPGVLDFQDAVLGPIAYDPICLFKDAFISWPAEQVEAWLQHYWRCAQQADLPVPAWAQFKRDADYIGIHRHLKVLGIFARICHRDGKPKYLQDAPRFIRYLLDVLPLYPELSFLSEILAREVLPRVDLSGPQDGPGPVVAIE